MGRKQIINGKVFDWSSVTIKLTGCEGIEPTEISYNDESGKELIYGKGGRIRGYGTGERKNSVKLTLLREDYMVLVDYIRKNKKGFYSLVIPNIVVSYADSGATTNTDTLKQVTFDKRDFSAKQGDTSLTVSVEGYALGGITTE